MPVNYSFLVLTAGVVILTILTWMVSGIWHDMMEQKIKKLCIEKEFVFDIFGIREGASK